MNLAEIRHNHTNFFKPSFLNRNASYKVRNKKTRTFLIESCEKELTSKVVKIVAVWEVLPERLKLLEYFEGYSRETKALEYVKTL